MEQIETIGLAGIGLVRGAWEESYTYEKIAFGLCLGAIAMAGYLVYDNLSA